MEKNVCDSIKSSKSLKNPDEEIARSISNGVIIIDPVGNIAYMNAFVENLIGKKIRSVFGKKYDTVIHRPLRLQPFLKFKELGKLQGLDPIPLKIFQDENSSLNLQLTVYQQPSSLKSTNEIILLLQDISRLKQIREEEIRNERLAAMGEIVINITHEIRNPLGCIELFASALKQDWQDISLPGLAENISKSVKTINSILSNINLFFKPDVKPRFSVIEVHDHLKESLFFTRHLLDHQDHVSIVKQFTDEKLKIKGDNELLKQMSMNIILNAFQAISGQGEIGITTKKIKDPLSSKNYVQIRYSDTGPGIPPVNMKKVFDPYFTTKNNGSGLGLPIVHKIVKWHGGLVGIEKGDISGTNIFITLPLAEELPRMKTA